MNRKSCDHETWLTNRYSQRQYFGLEKYYFEDWVLNPDPFKYTNLPQLIKNQSWVCVFLFWKLCMKAIKNSKHKSTKNWPITLYCHLSKLKVLELDFYGVPKCFLISLKIILSWKEIILSRKKIMLSSENDTKLKNNIKLRK